MAYMERLCLLLNCTPNDLLEWKPGEQQQNNKEHPLNALVRNGEVPLHNFLKSASPEDLEKVQQFITQMKKEQ